MPDIPIPALQMYVRDESLIEVGGGSPLRGPGLGEWDRAGRHQYLAHFKFFLFTPNGSRNGSEQVTSHIELTGPNTFEASATFDLFDPAGVKISEGCPINETATRSE